MPPNILLVEDDRNLAAVLADTLRGAGYEVECATQCDMKRVTAEPRDLVILDVLLPGESGFTMCRRMREAGDHTPVLMLTGLNDPASIVQGLREGADDYVTKPFDPAVLLARIQALLRRERLYRAHHLTNFRFGDVFIDFLKAVVVRKNTRCNLSAKEVHLLRYLILRRGESVSRHELLREVWGYPEAITRTVDVHIASLRQKVEDTPSHPAYIVTIRGEGYRFVG